MRLFLFVIITILFSYCNNKENKFWVVNDKFKQYVPKGAGDKYFPLGSLFFVSGDNQQSADSFVKNWYSETLFNLQEPILYNYSGEGEAIRLLWLRAFDNALIVRVSRFKDTVYANIKELKIKSSDKNSQILKDTILLLDTNQWEKILSGLQINNFWNAAVEDNSSGKDGIAWLLECRLNNKYQCINRWDDGGISSKDLNLYASELIKIGNSYAPMKSSR